MTDHPGATMTDPDPTKTVSLALTPITAGATPPNLQTDAFATVIAAAQQGGDATQAYFDGMNQTADYWGWVADNVGQGENVWADGVDPAGNPIQMSSNGNLPCGWVPSTASRRPVTATSPPRPGTRRRWSASRPSRPTTPPPGSGRI